jgi:hypothetical protein
MRKDKDGSHAMFPCARAASKSGRHAGIQRIQTGLENPSSSQSSPVLKKPISPVTLQLMHALARSRVQKEGGSSVITA